MFALCDCNNFYASAERLFKPALIDLPIVVLSNNDGCVIARSEEAKLLGIRMGDPAFLVRDLITKYDIQVFSSNYVLYGDLSERVMHNLGRWFPMVVPYSIDECFAWAAGITNIEEHAVQARSAIIRNTGIPVSIGIGPTKTLAKVANKLAKKNKGVFVMDSDESISGALATFPVEDLWGVGRQYYKKIAQLGIETVAQLRDMPELWFKNHMTVQGQRLYNELWGRPMLSIGDPPPKAKGLSVTRSFSCYIEDPDVLCEAVSAYASRLAEKLRHEALCCQFLEVFMFTNVHREDHPQHYPRHVHRMGVASNSTLEIVAVATKVARMLFHKGIKYRKAGVIATVLIPQAEVQCNLFQEPKTKHAGLSAVIDQINAVYGRGAIRVASEGFEKKWRLKHEYLSGGYTTRWQDIVAVK
ncbi:Y-family DNA polymerase [Sphingobacterium oryzagri]|uniref:Y-family DNA polymerase n=1 Tax=Sphingobacterium oryzagri TaxID=3025669 RepID=A0ABY7WPU5_9SPHI|nr:Y-family DNA polymerase [Sphingobacterium sp. KACC 22765]WDF70436.1 Y-family DNA polymerase [Sphingobacterium sp. KACC 22765]